MSISKNVVVWFQVVLLSFCLSLDKTVAEEKKTDNTIILVDEKKKDKIDDSNDKLKMVNVTNVKNIKDAQLLTYVDENGQSKKAFIIKDKKKPVKSKKKARKIKKKQEKPVEKPYKQPRARKERFTDRLYGKIWFNIGYGYQSATAKGDVVNATLKSSIHNITLGLGYNIFYNTRHRVHPFLGLGMQGRIPLDPLYGVDSNNVMMRNAFSMDAYLGLIIKINNFVSLQPYVFAGFNVSQLRYTRKETSNVFNNEIYDADMEVYQTNLNAYYAAWDAYNQSKDNYNSIMAEYNTNMGVYLDAWKTYISDMRSYVRVWQNYRYTLANYISNLKSNTVAYNAEYDNYLTALSEYNQYLEQKIEYDVSLTAYNERVATWAQYESDLSSYNTSYSNAYSSYYNNNVASVMNSTIENYGSDTDGDGVNDVCSSTSCQTAMNRALLQLDTTSKTYAENTLTANNVVKPTQPDYAKPTASDQPVEPTAVSQPTQPASISTYLPPEPSTTEPTEPDVTAPTRPAVTEPTQPTETKPTAPDKTATKYYVADTVGKRYNRVNIGVDAGAGLNVILKDIFVVGVEYRYMNTKYTYTSLTMHQLALKIGMQF